MSQVAALRRLVNGYQVSQAIHAAAVLGLADLITTDPRSVDDLAAAAGCDPDALYRLLRALATVEIFEELLDRRFRSTGLSDALRSDAEPSIVGWAKFAGRAHHWEVWSGLTHTVRTGENAFQAAHGMSPWEYRADRPEESAVFDAAMTSQSRYFLPSVLAAYDFSRFRTIADIGGGRGAFLAAILDRCPDSTGVLFDQPHVVANPVPQLATMADRCQVIGGSFFESIPPGADAYILKAVVHDWADEEALLILRNCRKVMSGDATLIVVERLMSGQNARDVAFSDLNMMIGPGGAERTDDEYAALFAEADLRLTTVVHTTTEMCLIEAVPA